MPKSKWNFFSCCAGTGSVSCVHDDRAVINKLLVGQCVVQKGSRQLQKLCHETSRELFDVDSLLLQGVMGVVEQRSMEVTFVDKGCEPFQAETAKLKKKFFAVWGRDRAVNKKYFDKAVDAALKNYVASLEVLITALSGPQNQLELRRDLMWYFGQLKLSKTLDQYPKFNHFMCQVVKQFQMTIPRDAESEEESKSNRLLPPYVDRSCVSLRR